MGLVRALAILTVFDSPGTKRKTIWGLGWCWQVCNPCRVKKQDAATFCQQIALRGSFFPVLRPSRPNSIVYFAVESWKKRNFSLLKIFKYQLCLVCRRDWASQMTSLHPRFRSNSDLFRALAKQVEQWARRVPQVTLRKLTFSWFACSSALKIRVSLKKIPM